jgi:ectoine hydroxylase-related dioxygenase (phytanoyl-CoA dioxygenase family)
MLGFIVPIDAFGADNGATRFVPGSHALARPPEAFVADARAAHPDEVLALAPAGAFIVYDGAIWHGYTANRTTRVRRSLQGAFVLRDEAAWVPEARRSTDPRRAVVSPLARYLLGAE